MPRPWGWCSWPARFDGGGPAGILTTAQLAYVGKAPSEGGRKQLIEVIEERLAAVGVTRSEIDVEDEGLVVEVGDYPEGELQRAWAVATRIGQLRIRPLHLASATAAATTSPPRTTTSPPSPSCSSRPTPPAPW